MSSLLLSIRSDHVERIFNSSKRFELRKVLPKAYFGRVFVYESGGVGVIGYFDVGNVFYKKINELWVLVGELGTEKSRFFDYFKKCEMGYAIEIIRPKKFKNPIPLNLLKRLNDFVVPQSYLCVGPDKNLYKYLEEKQIEECGDCLSLSAIRNEEKGLFVSKTTEEVGKNYDHISNKFGNSILSINMIGFDPNGLFTLRKQVFSIRCGEKLIGFTVLTHKLGGSLKTGPTIILDEFRKRGYGFAARKIIEEYARDINARKIYCTCPDNSDSVLRYLMKSGFILEAHLEYQYSKEHGEYILSKMLCSRSCSSFQLKKRNTKPCSVGTINQFSKEDIIISIERLFMEYFAPLEGTSIGKRIVDSAAKNSDEYESKGRIIHLLKSSGHCEGFLLATPKRGGSIKCMLVTATCHTPSIIKVIEIIEKQAETKYRKVFFLHPLLDYKIVEMLNKMGFVHEGILKEPYSKGVDFIVLSKFLN